MNHNLEGDEIMAHLVETMFYVGEVPWHGLGTKLDSPPNAKEAMIQAGCDWNVVVQPLYTPAFGVAETMDLPAGMGRIEEGRFTGTENIDYMQVGDSMQKVDIGGIIRRATDGAMLGLCGPRWEPYQNHEAFAWFDPLVESGMAILHTAGSLDGGKHVWVLAQIGNEERISGRDSIAQFLLLTVGHRGLSAGSGPKGIRVLPTTIRVVCANTLGMATRSEKETVVIPHTKNASSTMDDLRHIIEPHLAAYDETVELFKVLAKKDINSVMVERFLADLFPIDETASDRSQNSVIEVRNLIESMFAGSQIGDAEMAEGKRSRWSMYSAVTEYLDHNAGRSPETRVKNSWYGRSARVRKHALELLTSDIG